MADRKDIKLPVRSKGGNDYLISTGIPQVLLLHPVLAYLVKLRENGTNLDEWIEKPGQDGLGARPEYLSSNNGIVTIFNHVDRPKTSSKNVFQLLAKSPKTKKTAKW